MQIYLYLCIEFFGLIVVTTLIISLSKLVKRYSVKEKWAEKLDGFHITMGVAYGLLAWIILAIFLAEPLRRGLESAAKGTGIAYSNWYIPIIVFSLYLMGCSIALANKCGFFSFPYCVVLITGSLVLTITVFSRIYSKYGILDSSQYTRNYNPQSSLTIDEPNELYLVRDRESCFYFSMVTLTTLGYGDLKPSQLMRPIAAYEAVLGYVLMGAIVSVIVALCHVRDTSPYSAYGELNDLKRDGPNPVRPGICCPTDRLTLFTIFHQGLVTLAILRDVFAGCAQH